MLMDTIFDKHVAMLKPTSKFTYLHVTITHFHNPFQTKETTTNTTAAIMTIKDTTSIKSGETTP